MVNIAENIAQIRRQIADAAQRSGRQAKEIKLMAVSKFHPFERMREAADFVDLLGENRVQEAAGKRALWQENRFETPWHLIGSLQKNKARKALETFDLIESVDNFELAAVLNRVLEETDTVFPIYMEVNMSHEQSKSGVAEENALQLAEEILKKCPRLKIEGLMTIAPITEEEKAIRKAFCGLRELRDKLRLATGLELSELSMGMSGDFAYAIEEGSTIVRVGTAIFGKRVGYTL